MLFFLPRRTFIVLLLVTPITSVNNLGYAGGPLDNAAQKGASFCCKEHCGKEGCWSLWCPHKPFLYHRMPPLLPVVQSQPVRSTPAEAEPLSMRVQVRPTSPQEALRRDDGPQEPLRRPPGLQEPVQRDSAPHYQKGDSSVQKTRYLSADEESVDVNARFLRLERQMQMLLDKLDGLAEQSERPNASAPLRLPGSE